MAGTFSRDDDYRRLQRLAQAWGIKASGTKQALLRRLEAKRRRIAQSGRRQNPAYARASEKRRSRARRETGRTFSRHDDYRKLQRLAQAWGIKASGTKEDLVRRLEAKRRRIQQGLRRPNGWRETKYIADREEEGLRDLERRSKKGRKKGRRNAGWRETKYILDREEEGIREMERGQPRRDSKGRFVKTKGRRNAGWRETKYVLDREEEGIREMERSRKTKRRRKNPVTISDMDIVRHIVDHLDKYQKWVKEITPTAKEHPAWGADGGSRELKDLLSKLRSAEISAEVVRRNLGSFW